MVFGRVCVCVRVCALLCICRCLSLDVRYVCVRVCVCVCISMYVRAHVRACAMGVRVVYVRGCGACMRPPPMLWVRAAGCLAHAHMSNLSNWCDRPAIIVVRYELGSTQSLGHLNIFYSSHNPHSYPLI